MEIKPIGGNNNGNLLESSRDSKTGRVHWRKFGCSHPLHSYFKRKNDEGGNTMKIWLKIQWLKFLIWVAVSKQRRRDRKNRRKW